MMFNKDLENHLKFQCEMLEALEFSILIIFPVEVRSNQSVQE